MVLAVLILWARLARKDPDAALVRGIVEEADHERAVRAEDMRRVREGLGPEGPVPKDWNRLTALKNLRGPRNKALVDFATHFVDSPEDLPDSAVQELREQIEIARKTGNLTGSETRVDPASHAAAEITQVLCQWLRTCKEVPEFEAAFDLGLFPVFPAETDRPQESYFADYNPLFYLLSARAVCEARAGFPDSAAATCAGAYRMLAALRDGPLVMFRGPESRYFVPMDKALWKILDAGPLPETAAKMLLDQLDQRKAVDRVAKRIRVNAADLQAGRFFFHDADSLMEKFFVSRAARKVLPYANQLVELLPVPPYQVKEKLDTLQNDPGLSRSHLASRFVRAAVGAYRQHAWESLASDVFRAASALKVYKQVHGAYPASLDGLTPDLIPALPVDPLSGAPLVYQKEADGFRIATTEQPETWWLARK